MSHRQERVGHAFHREISFLIERVARDPRLEHVTVTDVRVSGDLRVATIYYSSNENDKLEEVQQGLSGNRLYAPRAGKTIGLAFRTRPRTRSRPANREGRTLFEVT